ncbi:unnamed protein product [Closterium sp. Yama58-4]|nr:unnamed protein product [Closterium sp. Yama58-4]
MLPNQNILPNQSMVGGGMLPQQAVLVNQAMLQSRGMVGQHGMMAQPGMVGQQAMMAQPGMVGQQAMMAQNGMVMLPQGMLPSQAMVLTQGMGVQNQVLLPEMLTPYPASLAAAATAAAAADDPGTTSPATHVVPGSLPSWWRESLPTVPPTVHSHSAARGKVGGRAAAGGAAGVAAALGGVTEGPGGAVKSHAPTEHAGMQRAAPAAVEASPKCGGLNKTEKRVDEQDEKDHTPAVAGGYVTPEATAGTGGQGSIKKDRDEDMCTVVGHAGDEGQEGGDAMRAAEAAWQGGDETMMQSAWWNAAEAAAAAAAAAEAEDAWMPFDFCPDPSTPTDFNG